MGAPLRVRTPKHGTAFAGLVAFAFALSLPSLVVGEQEGEAELYRWLDRHGVVRYTTDLGRIPNARRSTVVRVVPRSIPTATAQTAPAAPALGADPFNAPDQVQTVDSQDLATDAAIGSSWPELDARIAELEALVAKDEEALKEMISRPHSGDRDELIDSEALREIGARLPVLQGELAELKRWRDDPDTR